MRRRLLISVSVLGVTLLTLAALTASSELNVVRGLECVGNEEVSVAKFGPHLLLATEWKTSVQDFEIIKGTLERNCPPSEGWNDLSRGDERVFVSGRGNDGNFIVTYQRPVNRAELLRTLIRRRGKVTRTEVGPRVIRRGRSGVIASTAWNPTPSWFEVFSN
jgi:hypothetical protein